MHSAHFWNIYINIGWIDGREFVGMPKSNTIWKKKNHLRTENIENIRRARKFTSQNCTLLALFFFLLLRFVLFVVCIWLQSNLTTRAKRFHLSVRSVFYVPHICLIKIDWTTVWWGNKRRKKRVATDAAQK